jgi:hypothetical protein
VPIGVGSGARDMQQIHISSIFSRSPANLRSIRRPRVARSLVRGLMRSETRNIWCRDASDCALSSENTGFFVAL